MAAHAGQYDDFAVISSTLGVQDGRVCVGEASRGDIGCPTYAPYVASDGSISATRFVGDGSGLFNIAGASADRIVSGTTSMLAISNTGYISVTQSGVNTAYFHPSMGLVTVGVSSTGPISATDGYFSGAVGIGSSTLPSYGKTFTLYNDGSAASAATGNAAAIIQSVNRNTNLFLLGSASNSQMNIIFRKNLTQDAASIQYFNSNDSLQFIGLDASGDGIAKEAVRIQQGLVGVGVRRLPVANLEVSGTVSATRFVGNGSGLTGIASSSISLALDDLTDAAVSYPNGNMFGGSGVGSSASGISNTSFGVLALQNASTATRNAAFGTQALQANTTGGLNVAIGMQALFSNVSGSNNSAVGDRAMISNTTGKQNTAVGNSALRLNQTGDDNTAVGVSALYNNIGTRNIGIGTGAAYSNTSGLYNIAMGTSSLYNNASGYANVVVGDLAAYGSSGGNISMSVVIGRSAGYSLAQAERNVLMGYNAAYGLTSGADNIVIGYNAGNVLTSGTNNILIGSNASTTAATTSNQLNIGNVIYGDIGRGRDSRIGINVTSPTSNFEVSGTISATAIQVAASLPDSACASASDLGKMRRNPTTGRTQVCR